MAAGEYISVRVQREVFERLIHLEAHEIGSDPEAERAELAELYVRKGLPRDLADRLATELMKDPEVALDTHAREELGLDPRRGPRIAVRGGGLVVRDVLARRARAAAPVPVRLRDARPSSSRRRCPASRSSASAPRCRTSPAGARSCPGLRMLAIGATAAAVTYLVGKLLDVSVGL